VLASFARQVQQVVGEDGMVARMGGEEFAVVVNSGDARHGYELAERIRTTVANHPFTWRQQTLSLTVSIGLGSGKAEAWQLTEVFNKLMTEADDHLYRSKKAGRNRTSARVADEHITAATGHETELR
jgi:diguanylate cyclase (GGDEF)-like protein